MTEKKRKLFMTILDAMRGMQGNARWGNFSLYRDDYFMFMRCYWRTTLSYYKGWDGKDHFHIVTDKETHRIVSFEGYSDEICEMFYEVVDNMQKHMSISERIVNQETLSKARKRAEMRKPIEYSPIFV